MIIHPVETERVNGEIELSAKIELSGTALNYPDRLWYRFPEEHAEYVTNRSDAFVAGMLIPAMLLGEDVEVRGPVSPKLAYNLETVQRVYALKHGDAMKRVDIKYRELQPLLPDAQRTGVGSTFTGGIDSFYTLRAHLPKNQPVEAHWLTHGLFIHGMDVRLFQPEIFQALYERYQALYDRLGLQLLTVATNVLTFIEFRFNRGTAFNPPVMSAILTFSPLFNRFYLPSANGYLYGGIAAYTLSTHLFATETMDVILHDPTIYRYDKLEQLLPWEEVQNHLRVCVKPELAPDGDNCSRCAKCLNTQLAIKTRRLPEKVNTFKAPLTYANTLYWFYIVQTPSFHMQTFIKYAWKSRRWDYLLLLSLLYYPARLKEFLRGKLIGMIPPDLMYRLKSRRYPSDNPTLNPAHGEEHKQ